jgi:hypothetical protein
MTHKHLCHCTQQRRTRIPQANIPRCLNLRFTRSLYCTALLLTIVAWPHGATAQEIRYVDDDAAPGGDGATWNTAYRFLQDALAGPPNDPNGLEIRVAGGTQFPDRDEGHPNGDGNTGRSFDIGTNLELHGGYAGWAAFEPNSPADPNDQDPATYESVLSGDIGPESSIQVVSVNYDDGVNREAIIDGFTIEGANCVGYPQSTDCAGMYLDLNHQDEATISRCAIRGNELGIEIDHQGACCASVRIESCKLLNNVEAGLVV